MAWTRYSRAFIDPTSPRALGCCERCGFDWNQNRLSDQHDWRGPRLQNLNIFVCPDCLDEPQQNGQRSFRMPPDPVPIQNPSLDTNMIEGAGTQYGPDIVTNGGFASDDEWTLVDGALISGGALKCMGISLGAPTATQTSATTLVTVVYEYSFDVLYSTHTNTNIVITIGGVSSSNIITLEYNTTYTGQITVTSPVFGGPPLNQLLTIMFDQDNDAETIIDNFTVRRVL